MLPALECRIDSDHGSGEVFGRPFIQVDELASSNVWDMKCTQDLILSKIQNKFLRSVSPVTIRFGNPRLAEASITSLASYAAIHYESPAEEQNIAV
jgi:hypothetical protein